MKAIGLFCAGLFLFSACGETKKKSDHLSPHGLVNCEAERFVADKGVIPRLQPVERCSTFAGYLIASVLHNHGRSGTSYRNGFATIDLTEAVADSAASPAQYSGTNNQEAGVDEADFVKTDGKFIYVLAGEQLVILQSWPADSLTTVSSTQVTGQPEALLLAGDRLAVISHLLSNAWTVNDTPREFTPTARITIFDISNRSSPLLERTIDLELWYQAARLINGRLVFIGESSVPQPVLSSLEDVAVEQVGIDGDGGDTAVSQPSWQSKRVNTLTFDEVAAAIATTRYEQWIPSYLDSNVRKKQLLIDSFDDLYHPTVTGETGGLSLLTLDLEQPGQKLAKRTLMARGGIVYASADEVVISYSNNTWFWGCCSATPSETSLQAFRLNAESIPTYAGAGTVPGRIDSPFRLSEHEGYLRVASTDGKANYLTVLSQKSGGDLTVAGKVWGFAPGEDMTGSRFAGNRAFISTYFTVLLQDPFFTFDLADPASPQLIGALEMPGYTQYIHPLSDTHVLGLGMFAEAMGEPVTAVQVQVFDVSDFANPVTAHQYVLATGEGRSFSEALGSHHAFTYYPPEKTFAFPVSIWDGGWSTAFNGLVALRLELDTGFSELGRVNHQSVFDNENAWWFGDVRRSIFMTGNDGKTYLYTISNAGIMVHRLGDLGSPLATEALPEPEAGNTVVGAEPPSNAAIFNKR